MGAMRIVPIVMVIGVAALAACGSSGSNGGAPSFDVVAICKQSCDKQSMCVFGGDTTSCKAGCNANSLDSLAGPNCENRNNIVAVYQACLNMDCPGFVSCLSTIPACQTGAGGGSGTGAGGAGGTGSGGGGAGGTGGATCDVCVRADACCVAVNALTGSDGGSCTLAQSCAGLTGTYLTQAISVCMTFISTYASASPACR